MFVGGTSVVIGLLGRDAEGGGASVFDWRAPLVVCCGTRRDSRREAGGGGLSVQPGQLFHYRELTRTIHR